MKRTKKEIRGIISELADLETQLYPDAYNGSVEPKIKALRKEMETAPEDFMDRILDSHRQLCAAKNMDLKEAYGQDPLMYYTLGMCGEVGEMANGLVKSLRNGTNEEKSRQAIIDELPDAFIYGTVLAFVADVDIEEEILKKVDIVVERANSGYYGVPFKPKE